LKKQELFNEEQSVTLTRLETQVLSALAKADRNFLEHWQLMEHFGAPEADMGIAALQMRISRLRKKIQKIIPQDELISSERGLGYRLALPIKII
jgi:DNA-binding response OmpR family regulator